MLAVALFGATLAASMLPATVHAGGGKMLEKCLADRASEPDQRRVQSECRWEYYDYMASYGR
jgi:hypothetical protein